MQPTDSRDFLRAAAQRLIAADALAAERLTLDAQYMSGYVVECALKALLLHRTPPLERPTKLVEITAGHKWHVPEILLGELRKTGVALPLDIAKRLRRFKWDTGLRYETGRRDTAETNGMLRTARAVYDWVQKEIP